VGTLKATPKTAGKLVTGITHQGEGKHQSPKYSALVKEVAARAPAAPVAIAPP
jgi:hypothetical protein